MYSIKYCIDNQWPILFDRVGHSKGVHITLIC
jgi:hypothetical protein